jgi:integrase
MNTSAPSRSASGQPWLKRLDTGIWQINLPLGNGKTRRVSTRTEDEAHAKIQLEQFRLSLESEHVSAILLTVSDVFNYYRKEHVKDLVNDVERREYALGWLEASLGKHRLNELTPELVRNYVRKRREGTAPVYADRVTTRAVKPAGDGTLRHELATLTTAFRFAVENKKIPEHSLPRIKLPAKPAPKDVWLTEEEHDWLLAFVQDEDKDGRMTRLWRFVAIGLGTAARKSAIGNLTWDMIDLGAELIHFPQAEQREGAQSSSKKTVPVPICDWLLPLLQRAYKERINEYVLDDDTLPAGAFRTLKKRAYEASDNLKFLELTPHVLRHTAATLMARSGIDIPLIAGVLGNSAQVCLDNYLHHSPSYLRSAVNHRKRSPDIEGLL